MAHKVLKPFRYSHNGIDSRETAVDEVLHDLPADQVEGLTGEGYIAEHIIADGSAAETASKVAGETIVAADHAGSVDSDLAVKQEAAAARAGISDGHIGAPEAASIVDAHQLTDLSDPAVIQAAQDEKAAHEDGDTGFDPKAPENVDAAAEKVADAAEPKPAKKAHAKKD